MICVCIESSTNIIYLEYVVQNTSGERSRRLADAYTAPAGAWERLPLTKWVFIVAKARTIAI